MHPVTTSILAQADAVPGYGRRGLFNDIIPLIKSEMLYTTNEVAERVKVTIHCVKKWQAQGRLKESVKISGGTVRFTEEDIQNLINNRKGNK